MSKKTHRSPPALEKAVGGPTRHQTTHQSRQLKDTADQPRLHQTDVFHLGQIESRPVQNPVTNRIYKEIGQTCQPHRRITIDAPAHQPGQILILRHQMPKPNRTRLFRILTRGSERNRGVLHIPSYSTGGKPKDAGVSRNKA